MIALPFVIVATTVDMDTQMFIKWISSSGFVLIFTLIVQDLFIVPAYKRIRENINMKTTIIENDN